MTKNLGNYESAKLEVEAAPSDGQTAEQLLVEVNDYLSKQMNGMPVTEKPVKKDKAKADPPLPKTDAVTPAKMVEAKPPAEKKARGKGSKKAELQAAAAAPPSPEQELQYAIDSETLPELLERFNNVSKMRDKFAEQWEAAVTRIADRYRKLNSLDADPVVLDQIVKAFKRERQKIEEVKAGIAA
jgi:hypothetical protein